MKVSTRARYALRLMVDLYRHSCDARPVQLREVALRTELSKGYLEHLAAALRNRSLLRGVSGPKGGYVLARPAEEILILDIIEASIGPICISSCLSSPEVCKRSHSCECQLIWRLLNDSIRKVLGDYSLADMALDTWRSRIEAALQTRIQEEHLGDAAIPNETADRGPDGSVEIRGSTRGKGPRIWRCQQTGERAGE